MELDATQIKQKYIEWLNEEIGINKINEFIEITSPFLDMNNDYLQIYVKLISPDQIFITDDGYTIENLQMSGIELDTAKRKEIMNTILNKYGVKNDNNSLFINSTQKEFPQKIMLLMQAMLNIGDMFMLSQNRIASLFNDDVKKFFVNNGIYYSENVSFIGKSGLYFSYDYLLQRTKEKPERLCKAVNNPNLQSSKNNIFMWNDTKATRNQDSQFIVLLNDNTPVSSTVIEAYNNYDIKTILWSEKEKYLSYLSA